MSDMEFLTLSKKLKPIIHFDCLNKATNGVRQMSFVTVQITSSKSDFDDTALTYTIKINAKLCFAKIQI